MQSQRFFHFLFLCLPLVLCGGCGTTKPASASFASVVIQDKEDDAIRHATAEVFQADGYQVGTLGPGTMVFQREGTYGQSLAYNGIIGTHYGERTAVRVRADIVDLGAGAQRLQCHAFMVRNAGDTFFEDVTALPNRKAGPYQKLLNQVAEKLK